MFLSPPVCGWPPASLPALSRDWAPAVEPSSCSAGRPALALAFALAMTSCPFRTLLNPVFQCLLEDFHTPVPSGSWPGAAVPFPNCLRPVVLSGRVRPRGWFWLCRAGRCCRPSGFRRGLRGTGVRPASCVGRLRPGSRWSLAPLRPPAVSASGHAFRFL